MGVNSLPKTVTRQRRDYDLNPCPSEPESSTLTTRLQGHPCHKCRLHKSTCLQTANQCLSKSESKSQAKVNVLSQKLLGGKSKNVTMKKVQVIDIQSNFREGNLFVWTVYSLTKLLGGVLVQSMGNHDATHGEPTSRGRRSVCSKRRRIRCKSTYSSWYHTSAL